ncbi:MAG: hypothetical protein ACLUD1_08985 [Clostridia bacterium]
MDITNFILTQTVAVTVIVGPAQVARKLKEKYIPLFNIIIAIILNLES